MNNYIIVVFDSCRYDSLIAARPKHIRRLGKIEKRWSYATWTGPSHFNLLTGLMPHSNPRKVYAAEYYRREFFKFNQRLGAQNLEFKSFLPRMYLPVVLRKLGYRTHALVSMPVLNSQTLLNQGFDSWKLMPRHNDMRAMLREMSFDGDGPSFYLMNTGETHYPYALPDEPEHVWPRMSGVHGVFGHLDDFVTRGKLRRGAYNLFTREQLQRLKHRQIEAARHLDGVVEELFHLVPKNTWITITSDHGELFGEGGFFGHGPTNHPKVLEVPFVEGNVP